MLMRLCAALLLLGLVAGCGEDAEPKTADASESSSPADRQTQAPTTAATEPAEPAESPEAPATGTRIVVDDSEFGPMLFDANGQAIYLFDVETSAEPRCYEECATAWPPVLTTGQPVAGQGVDSAMLGTTERTDGSLQVTYGDHPLYFYAHEGPGEVKCHDIFLNGGNWYVVQPDGDAAPPG